MGVFAVQLHIEANSSTGIRTEDLGDEVLFQDAREHELLKRLLHYHPILSNPLWEITPLASWFLFALINFSYCSDSV